MNYPPQQGPYGAQPPGHPQQPQWGQPQGAHYPGGGVHPQQHFWQQVAGGPPPQPPRKNRTGLILGLAGAGFAVLIVAAIALVTSLLSPDEVEAGECMSLEDERGGAMSAADCGSPDSDYRVVKVRDGHDLRACGDDYANVFRDSTYCVRLDVRAGDCLTSFQEDAEILPLKIACGTAQDQVTRVVPGQDPEHACQENEGYYVFSRETVCFSDVQGA